MPLGNYTLHLDEGISGCKTLALGMSLMCLLLQIRIVNQTRQVACLTRMRRLKCGVLSSEAVISSQLSRTITQPPLLKLFDNKSVPVRGVGSDARPHRR